MVNFRKVFSMLGISVLTFAGSFAAFAQELSPQTTEEEMVQEAAEPSVRYVSQVQDKGWQNEAGDGTLSGTQGEARRLETIKIWVENMPVDGGITYRSLIEDRGWTDWVENGGQCGTVGLEKAIRGVQIKLTGTLEDQYDVYYRTFIENYGWLDYASNGVTAGTIDLPLRVEALEIRLMTKGMEAPGPTAVPNRALYEYRTEADGKTYLYDFDGNRVKGWFQWNQARYYGENGLLATGWKYIDGLKFYFDENHKLAEDVDSLLGKQSSYQIKINKQMNCVTIYAKDGKKGYIIPVKAMLCTTGPDTPTGTFQTPEKYRWRLMVNDSYSQYATRIIAGKGFLIHSVGFWKQDNHTLMTDAYNNLGIYQSLGCVRLTTGNAKWIYDHCPLGTTVIIYNSENAGPFTKPSVVPIPKDQNWDPTDPNVKHEAKAK